MTRMTKEKWIVSAIKKHGSLEAARKFQSEAGALGGKAEKTRPAGWAAMAINDPERLKKIAIAAGEKSRRRA